MPSTPLTWRLTISSDLRLLSVARSFAESVCQAACLSEADTGAVILALHEAVSNVIRHAHQDLPGAALTIECTLGDDRMEIYVQDEGPPFNLAAVPAMNPAEMRMGGRGVFLMRTLMDELHCAPLPERGNLLRMVKYLTRKGRHHERY
jgi:serine/threonine-protein kinase RsbW